MNDQGVNALRSRAGRFLLSTKGAAAPSPAIRTVEEQTAGHVTKTQTGGMPANGLSGLIKRVNPVRHHQLSEPINFNDFRKLKAAAVRPVSKEKLAPTKRRQLTVRVEMGQFEKIDRLSRSENKTYQSIQAEALKMYLKTRVDEQLLSND